MNWSPNATYEAWKVLAASSLDEFKSQTVHLRHKSGFEVFHVVNDNPENLFAFAFKTMPQDNTGVAHILEHTVLCGSERYPVKDPFLNLIKSSLNTFLNAFTFPDKTVYAASSAVEKDFFNLMRVYANAVFHPLLEHAAFYQEGWHFKRTEEGTLDVSGIVYNEMKGAYSASDSLQQELTVHSLFDQSIYQFDSGGNPDDIPSLTYEDFVAFHHAHYHPSQTMLFLFGNVPLETQLDFLDKEVLAHSVPFPAQPLPALSPEPRWDKPRFKTILVPPSEDSELASVLVSWLTADITQAEDVLGLEILAQILLSDASPLVLKLLGEGYGEDLSPLSGYESEIRDTLFSLGMRGVPANKTGSFYQTVMESLRELVDTGIEKELVEGILFSFDFSLREIKGSGQGLRLMRRALRGWVHGRDPLESLVFAQHLAVIRQKWMNGRYFEELTERYLLSNPHHTCLTFEVDLQYEEKHRAQFVAWLATQEKIWLPSRSGELATIASELRRFQDQQDTLEALATLPILKKEDLPRVVRQTLPLVPSPLNPNLLGVDVKTNGIVYVNLYFSLSHVEPNLFPYLGLFHRSWDSVGTINKSPEELDKAIHLTFGHFYFSLHHETSLEGKYLPHLCLTMATTADKQVKALALTQEILHQVNFDNEKRLKELLLELKNDFGPSLTQHGNQYAELAALAQLDTTSALKNSTSGMSAYQFWLEHTRNIDKTVRELKTVFAHLRTLVLHQQVMKAVIVSEDKETRESWTSGVQSLAQTFSTQKITKQVYTPSQTVEGTTAILIKTKVNFNAQAFKGVPLTHEDYPTEVFVSHFLKSHHLWKKIRMRGGAYGAGASAYGTGYFSFTSYRDPHTQRTLDMFGESLTEIANTPLSEEEIHSTLIGMLGSDLAPIAPNAHAVISFKLQERGVSDTLRQEIRNGYFAVNSTRLRKVASKLWENWQSARTVSLTSEALMSKEPFKGAVHKVSI